MEQAVRRLTRSRRDRVFAGVCGGLAAYLGLDPVLVRVLYVALTLLSYGWGILIYFFAWILIPLEPEGTATNIDHAQEPTRAKGRHIAGVLLVIVGLLALLSMSFGWFHVFSFLRLAGPLLLLLTGILLLVLRRDSDAPVSRDTGPTGDAPQPLVEMSTKPSDEPRRLYRSESGRKMAGVCAGLGEYFSVDPTIIRLIFIAAIFAGGAGIILYLLMWIVVPRRREAPAVSIGA